MEGGKRRSSKFKFFFIFLLIITISQRVMERQ